MSKADKRENIIMVASEPLTFEKGMYTASWPHARDETERTYYALADWMEIKTNHMVVITPKMNLLQFPIIDKYYVPPSDPAALSRGIEFAASKGYLSARRDVPIRPVDLPMPESYPVLVA